MTIVIAGGTGFLGTALAGALRRDAPPRVVLTRPPTREHDVPWSTGRATRPGPRRSTVPTPSSISPASPSPAGGGPTARKAAIRGSRIASHRRPRARDHSRTTAASASSSVPRRSASTASTAMSRTEKSAPGIGLSRGRVPRLGSDRQSGLTRVASGAPAKRPRARARRRRTSSTGAAVRAVRGWTGRHWTAIHLVDSSGRLDRDGAWAIESAALTGPLNLTAPAPVTNEEFSRTSRACFTGRRG